MRKLTASIVLLVAFAAVAFVYAGDRAPLVVVSFTAK
jgi:hypothetical protein